MVVKSSPRDELNTVPEAANQLRVSVATIRAWILQRRITSVRVGRAVRIPQSAIDLVVEVGTIPADERRAIA